MWTGMTIDARDLGIVADGMTDMAEALTETLAYVAEAGGAVLALPAGTIRCNSAVFWPAANGLTLTGQGLGLTTLEFVDSADGGLVYNAGTRISACWIKDLSIHGGGETSGIGLDLSDWDRGGLEHLRVYVWDTCIRINSTASGGALHNEIVNCRLTNGFSVGLLLTGAQGPHQSHIHRGEISICGTGLWVDAPTDATYVEATSFESNGQAIYANGVRSHYRDIRLEGNEADVHFGPESGYNILSTGFWEAGRHRDDSGSSSNRIMPHGYWTSQTEYQPLLYVPVDPMCVKMSEQIPGAGMAVSHLFDVYEARRVSELSFVPCAQAGNVEMGLFEADGTMRTSTGPVPVGAEGMLQNLALTDPVYLGPARRYYICILFDSETAGFYGFTASPEGFQLGQNEILARQSQLDFPFGQQNPITSADGTTMTLFARIG